MAATGRAQGRRRAQPGHAGADHDDIHIHGPDHAASSIVGRHPDVARRRQQTSRHGAVSIPAAANTMANPSEAAGPVSRTGGLAYLTRTLIRMIKVTMINGSHP
jgi:hypothetical protein